MMSTGGLAREQLTLTLQVLRHEEFTEAGDIEIKRFLKKKADLLQKVM